MPDFFNGSIESGSFTDPTDIIFTTSGVTSLTLGPLSATFGVPLVGDGSGLTGVTGGGASKPPQSFRIQNTATSNIWWCPTAGNTSAIPTSSSLQAFYPWMSPFQLQEDVIINQMSTEVISGVAGLEFMMAFYELDADFNCSTLVVETTKLSGDTAGLKTFTLGSPVTLLKDTWYGAVILGDTNFNHRACIGQNIIGGLPTSAGNYSRFRMNYYAFPASMPASLNIDVVNGITNAVSIWIK